MTKRAVDKTKRWVRNQEDMGGWGVYGLFRSLHFHFPWNNKFIWEISMSTALSSFEEGGGQWKGGAQLVWFSVTSVLIVGSWSHHNWKEIHKIILDCNRLPRNNKFIWGDIIHQSCHVLGDGSWSHRGVKLSPTEADGKTWREGEKVKKIPCQCLCNVHLPTTSGLQVSKWPGIGMRALGTN